MENWRKFPRISLLRMKNRKEIIRIRISHRFYAFLKRPTREYVSNLRRKTRCNSSIQQFSIRSKLGKRKNNETISKPFKLVVHQTEYKTLTIPLNNSQSSKRPQSSFKPESHTPSLLSSYKNLKLSISFTFNHFSVVAEFFEQNHYRFRGNGNWPKLFTDR